MRFLGRWLRRTVLLVLALALVGAVALTALLDSPWGRDLARDQVVTQLDGIFVGHTSIGSIEGSPFDTLIAHDVVIDDADGNPAIAAKTVTIQVELEPLLHHTARLREVTASDVTVIGSREDDGALTLAHLLKPTPGRWDVEIAHLAVHRGTLVLHPLRDARVELRAIELEGTARIPHGAELTVALHATGAWVDRAEHFDVVGAVTARGPRGIVIPAAFVWLDGSAVAVRDIAIAVHDPVSPVTGFVAISARAADLERATAVRVPDDVVAGAILTRSASATDVALSGRLGVEAVTAWLSVDLRERRVTGIAQGPSVDLTRFGVPLVERGRVAAVFSATREAGRALVVADGDGGQTHARTALYLTGRFAPTLDVAVAGSVDAFDVRVGEVRAAAVHVALDARDLPARPAGSAHVTIARLRQGTTELGELRVDAASRPDRRIAVAIRSRPKAAAQLDLDGVVAITGTPGALGFEVDLGDHHVRMRGQDWSGTGGHVAITPSRIAIAGLHSKGAVGAVAIDGTYTRATGDFEVRASAKAKIDFAALLDGGALAGEVHVTRHGRAIAIGGRIDAGRDGSVVASARLRSPIHPFDAAAWRALGPDAIEELHVSMPSTELDPVRLARFGIATKLAGSVGVAIDLTAGGRGTIAVDVHQLRGSQLAEPIDARVEILATGTELQPRFTLTGRDRAVLVDGSGTLATTLGELVRDPRRALTRPLAIAATLPGLARGKLRGRVAITGTLALPAIRADLAGDGGGTLALSATGDPRKLATEKISLVAHHFDLAPLLAYAPGVAGGVAGKLDADVQMTGLDENARFVGHLTLLHGRVPLAPTIGTLRAAHVDIRIANDKLVVTADGKLGAGTVKLTGEATLVDNVPTRAHANIAVRGVSPIGGIQPKVDADVTADLRREHARWVADIVVDHGKVVVPDDRGEQLAPIGSPDDVVLASSAPAAPHAHAPVILATITIHPVFVQSSELRGYIEGKLTVAPGDRVSIVGDVDAVRGDLDLFGRRYLVERGALHFDGSTDPLLDIRVVHDFPDVTTVTEIHGRLSKPELQLSSSPAIYTNGQMLGFLLGGEPGGDPANGNARDMATSAGTSVIANKLGKYVERALPIDLDVLRYDGATATNSSSVTVGSWLTRTLFVAYRHHLEARPDENTGEGELEYWLTRKLVVEGAVGDRGHDGIDLLWRHRY